MNQVEIPLCLGEPECDYQDLQDGYIYHAGWCSWYDADKSGVHSVDPNGPLPSIKPKE